MKTLATTTILILISTELCGQASSVNSTIQDSLNRGYKPTQAFKWTPTRRLSEEAKKRYETAHREQAPLAIERTKAWLKRIATYRLSRRPSDRQTYATVQARLSKYESKFVPMMIGHNVGAIGTLAGDAEVLQVISEHSIRAKAWIYTDTDWNQSFPSEVIIESNFGTAVEEGHSVATDGIVFEVVRGETYTTILGASRTLPVLEPIDMSEFGGIVAEPLAVIPATPDKSEEEASLTDLRRWMDRSGKSSVIASYAGLTEQGKSVRLRKQYAEETVNVPLDSLSATDIVFLEDALNRRLTFDRQDVRSLRENATPPAAGEIEGSWIGIGIPIGGACSNTAPMESRIEFAIAAGGEFNGTISVGTYSPDGTADRTSIEFTAKRKGESLDLTGQSLSGSGGLRHQTLLLSSNIGECVSEHWFFPEKQQGARNQLAGVYEIRTGRKVDFKLTLHADGSAQKSHAPKTLGRWNGTQDAILVAWGDGWRDMLVRENGAWKKRAFKGGASLADDPINSAEAFFLNGR